MDSDFQMLYPTWGSLADLAMSAEQNVDIDPSACIIELGSFAEEILKRIIQSEGTLDPGRQMDRITLLQNAGVLPRQIVDILHSIRMDRNDALHNNVRFSSRHAHGQLTNATTLARWFMRYYGYTPTNQNRNQPASAYIPNCSDKLQQSERTVYIPQETPSLKRSAKPWLILLLIISVFLNIIQFIFYHFL